MEAGTTKASECETSEFETSERSCVREEGSGFSIELCLLPLVLELMLEKSIVRGMMRGSRFVSAALMHIVMSRGAGR